MPVLGGPHYDFAGVQRADASPVTTPIAHGGEPNTQSAVQVGVDPPTTSITYNNGLYTPSPTSAFVFTPLTIGTVVTISSADDDPTSSTTSTDSAATTDASSSISFASLSSLSSAPSSSTSRSSARSTASSAATASPQTTSSHRGWSMTYNLIIAGSVILLVGIIGLVYTRRRIKRRKNRLLAEEYLTRRMPNGWIDEDNNDDQPHDMRENRQSRIDAEDAGVAGLLGQSRYGQGQPNTQQFYDDHYTSSTSATDFGKLNERGWAWGTVNAGTQSSNSEAPRSRRNRTPPNAGRHERMDSDDLNAVLAESRTGYTPAEAEQTFGHQRQPSFAERLYGATAADQRTISDRSANPSYGFSRTKPLRVANPDLPRAPSSIQTSDTQISRSVKRWQLSDTAGPPSPPVTPKSNRYQDLIPRESPYRTPERPRNKPDARLPSSLQPARFTASTSSSPLSPPAQPNLFFSASATKSPGCPMPPPSSENPTQSISLAGIASLVFPSYENGPNQTPSEDIFTSLPSRNAITSPLSETSDYSQGPMSPQRHRTVRKAIANRQRGHYQPAHDLSPEKTEGTLLITSDSQDSLEELLRQVR